MIPEVLPPPVPDGAGHAPSARASSVAFDHALRSAVAHSRGAAHRSAVADRPSGERHDDHATRDEAGAAGIAAPTGLRTAPDTPAGQGDDAPTTRAAETSDGAPDEAPAESTHTAETVTAETPPGQTLETAEGSDPSDVGAHAEAATSTTTAASRSDQASAPSPEPSPPSPAVGAAADQGRAHAAAPAVEHSPALADPATAASPTAAAADATPTPAEVAPDDVDLASPTDAVSEPDADATTQPSADATTVASEPPLDDGITRPIRAGGDPTPRPGHGGRASATAAEDARHPSLARPAAPGTSVPSSPSGRASTPDAPRDGAAMPADAGLAHAGAAAAPAPAAATTHAPSAVPVPSAPAAPPPPVVDQLVGHVGLLAGGPEGTHEVTIELSPAELGRVRLRVTLDDGVVHVRLHADDPASRRLLARSMGELRSALTGAGVRTGDLDVRDQAWRGPHDEPHRPDGAPPAADTPRSIDVAAPIVRTRAVGSARSAVDVLL